MNIFDGKTLPLADIQLASVRRDIQEFADANGGADLSALTLTQALEMYLRWNGIHGFTAQILSIVRSYTR